ncbi:MAG: hypothetical protein B5M55_00730 [Desulfococcus sp. 4484_242]|nr:MAG: hypothetical protein B5M55_00730 [Desulfococcus sp. 4484_242]
MSQTYQVISAALPKERCATALLLFLFSFLFFCAFRIPVPCNVDTFLYARAIKTLEGPVVHFGYYVIGSFCQALLGRFGYTPPETLGLLSQFLGGVSVSSLYVFSFLTTKDHLQGLVAALLLMFSGTFWLFSIHGEVYVPQLAFVLLSLAFIQKQMPFISSLCLLIAISITPTSLLALAPIGYLMYTNRSGTRQATFFLAPIATAFIAVMLWNGSKVVEVFTQAIYSPAIFLDEFSWTGLLREVVYRIIKAYGRSFNIVLFFVMTGFAVVYKNDRRQWGLTLFFLIPFMVYLFNLGLLSGDHLIISFVAVSLLGSHGILKCLDWMGIKRGLRSLAIILILSFYVLISFEFLISRPTAYSKELARVIHALSKRMPDNGIILADYCFGVTYASMTFHEKSMDLFEGRPAAYVEKGVREGEPVFHRLNKPFWISFACIPGVASKHGFRELLTKRPLYLVETLDWRIGLIQVFKEHLKSLKLENPRDKIQRLNDITRYLQYKLGSTIMVDRIIDSPLHPVYRLRAVGDSENRQDHSTQNSSVK